MATAPSTYLKSLVPQPATYNQFDSSPLVLPRKRPPSELYYSSYGESEGTPIRKTRRTRHFSSTSGQSSDPSSPIFHSTPRSTQVPKDFNMEESADESDDVYDQFDLKDFTKEEIKIYESMVGPGERLRDAASPEDLPAPAWETTADTSEDPLGPSVTRKIPKDLHDMLRAGLWNAICRVVEDNMLPMVRFGKLHDSDCGIDCVVRVIMKELAKPAPQIERFIRDNRLRRDICDDADTDILRYNYGPRISTKIAHRIFEQEVYDFGRSTGLSREQAIGHVIIARESSSKRNIELAELGDYESSQCENILNYLDLEDLPDPEAFKTKEEKATRNDAKKAHKVELRAQRKALRQMEKKGSQERNDYQTGKLKEPGTLACDPEHPSKVPPIEDQDEPIKGKKKKNKRKSEPGNSVQFDVPSEEHHKQKKAKMDKGAQDTSSKKRKMKKGTGPQHSPFFQRSSGPEAKKRDVIKKAEQVMDFQSPMIQPPPAGSPSTPVKESSVIVTTPRSDDSSPLSSLRSTPSLLSFGGREAESDKKRIMQLSRSCARSESVAFAQKLQKDPNHLPTPTSSPISLRELNKRLLEGTIYQDGIVLVKPEAPTTHPVPKKPRKRSVTVSPFFTKLPSKKRKTSDKVSCIPFPPLHSTSFGLVQERLSHDPFRLLIAVIFLNKTRGSVALPVFYKLMDRYPTPADLAAAHQDDVVKIIQHLGLQNQRAKNCINLAKAWLERPPEKGKRYRVLHYPKRDDGKDVRPGDVVGEEDERVAWEIGQLPGIGVYAIDSWRIFCRDELRGLPTGLPQELTPEATEEELQKEWTRVLAGDKELRAYLRWRWLRTGWEWDPVTGERRKADEGELAKAGKGGFTYEGDSGDMVVGDAKTEGSEAAKAELEVEENGNVNPESEADEADAMTAGPRHSDAIRDD